MRTPKTRDIVIDNETDMRGEIISVDRENEECVVKFCKIDFFLSSTCVLAYAGDRFWDARGCPDKYRDVLPEYVNEYGEPRAEVYDVKSYVFDDLSRIDGIWEYDPI